MTRYSARPTRPAQLRRCPVSSQYVVGLDLSLTSTGICVMPLDWDQRWHLLDVSHVGCPLPRCATEAQRMERLELVIRAVRQAVMCTDVVCVAVEQYAYSRGQSQAHALGELGGATKLELHRRGLLIVTPTASAARAVLGVAPRTGAKAWAHAQLRSWGAPAHWTGDELDAFAVANWAVMEMGGVGLIGRSVA